MSKIGVLCKDISDHEDEQVGNNRTRPSYNFKDKYFWGSVKVCKLIES